MRDDATCTEAAPTRVFLRVRHKRARTPSPQRRHDGDDDGVGDGELGDARGDCDRRHVAAAAATTTAPRSHVTARARVVRLCWGAELGGAPAPLRSFVRDTANSLRFRALPPPHADNNNNNNNNNNNKNNSGSNSVATTVRCAADTTASRQLLTLQALRKTRSCLVLECASAAATATTTTTTGDAPVHDEWFVLDEQTHNDKRGPAATAATAATVAAHDSAAADDDFDFDALTLATVPTHDTASGKRTHREEDDDDVFYLQPRKRAAHDRDDDGRDDMNDDNDNDSSDCHDSRRSAWGRIVVADDDDDDSAHAEQLYALLLQADDATRSAHDDVARDVVHEPAASVQADLYCYPDHRRDDEYDSNAEDCSANDYPDDDDDDDDDARDNDDDDDDTGWSHRTHATRTTACVAQLRDALDAYGVRGRESSLGRGWRSDDDDDDDDGGY